MINRKRGLSPVIATLALVLLTVGAVTILSGFLTQFTRERLKETDCFTYRDYFYFQEENGYNCYSQIGENSYLYGISIGARASNEKNADKITGFKLAFHKEGESTTADVKKAEAVNPDVGGVRMLNSTIEYIELPNVGEVRTYIYNTSTNTFSSVEVYPLLEGNKVCDSADAIDVREISCGDLDMDTKD